MSNAVKFTNQENGEIKIKLIDQKDKIIISIQENGIGIPENKLNTIFNR